MAAKKSKRDTGPTSGGRFKRSKNGPAIDRAHGAHLLTEQKIGEIVRLVQAGNYIEVAARACGINKSTFYEWLKRGGEGEEPFKALADAVHTAAAMAEVRDFTLIGQHAKHDWRAAAWRLERKHADRYGRKDALELSGDQAKPVAITVIKWGPGEGEEIEFS